MSSRENAQRSSSRPPSRRLVARIDAHHRGSIAVHDRDADVIGGNDFAHAHDHGLDHAVEIEPRQDGLVDVGERQQRRELAAEARRHRIERLRRARPNSSLPSTSTRAEKSFSPTRRAPSRRSSRGRSVRQISVTLKHHDDQQRDCRPSRGASTRAPRWVRERRIRAGSRRRTSCERRMSGSSISERGNSRDR